MPCNGTLTVNKKSITTVLATQNQQKVTNTTLGLI